MNRQRPQIFPSIAIAVTIFTLTPGVTAMGQTTGTAKVKTISLGLVSITFQNEIEEHFRDLAQYVARKLSPDTVGRVVVASTALQMAKLLNEKTVDFYMESTYPTYLINRQGSAVLILRRWKGGLAEYRSLIFARKDSGISRIEDLRGKMIAFEDPGSTSGFFQPKVFLLKKGFQVTEKRRADAKVVPGEIGYVFEAAEQTVTDMVLEKLVSAGAFSDDDYATLDAKSKAAIVILAETEKLPRHLVSTRKDLSPAIKKGLTEILQSMHQDQEGRRILIQADNTTKFDLLPGGEEMVRRKFIELFRPYGKK
jgi:phosphonate transport system substrate-binding protein